MPELGELVECAAPDCSRTFQAVRRHQRWCCKACGIRMWRWRQYGEAQRKPLYSDALAGADLDELRRAAVSELVHGALEGADPTTMAKVASLVVAVDRRLGRAG